MSDVEDEIMQQAGSDDPMNSYREDDQAEPPEETNSAGQGDEQNEDEEPPRRSRYEDDEEDEEEEEEEEEAGAERGKKKVKRRHRRSSVSRFIDFEAEVSDDEEEEDYDEEEGHGDFLVTDAGVDGDHDEANRRTADHARLDRRERELDDQDLARIAEDYSKRYQRPAMRYSGDLNEIPQRLLMPSVHDANLWQVRVKPGKERDLVFSLMRKAIDLEYSSRPLQILSAFQRDSLPGMIYVEARSAKQVNEACNGLVGIYPSRGIVLVPIEEMASLLQIKKQDLTVTPGSWVRIKRGKYQGDLAQVMDITENGEEVGLKFIPRIDLNPKDDTTAEGKKRKKLGLGGGSATNLRPPQRFFNYEEVIKVYGRKTVSKRNQVYVFQNDTYKDGFIEKDFRLTGLQLENVNPTLDEITRFTKGQDGTENETSVDLSIIAEASRKAAISVLQPGDHVEVFEGEQSGVQGTVQSVEQDTVTVVPIGVEFDGQKVQIPARSVRKRFKPGDHVKVMTGTNADETGLVVSVADTVVTFLSDMSLQEVSVFSKDLREAAEVGSGTNVVGNYELHDLVQLDLQTVGVIYKTERDSFRVLDQNGQTRLVQPHQISMRRDSSRAIANDSEGHELRINDNVKEVEGLGRKGRVLHIHQSFYAFLHNRDYLENGGIFVTRARSLASLAPKGNVMKTGVVDLSKMNPAMSGGAMTGGMVGSGHIGRGPRDRLIGVTVIVKKGPNKGYVGSIKDTNGHIARVELHAGNKMITIEKDKLLRRNENGSTEPLESDHPGGGSMGPPRTVPTGRTPNPYATPGARTPGWGGGRTPNPYNPSNDSRTPAWAVNSRTPNPYAEGSRTPAWNVSSRTPNPYVDGSRTPAWQVSSKTPNPYSGGGTGSGGAWTAGGASDTGWVGNNWGNTSPGRSGDTSNDWQSENWAAQTPREALTPYDGPLTPGLSASTPGFSSSSSIQAPIGVVQPPESPAYFSAPTPKYNPVGSGMTSKTIEDESTRGDDWITTPGVKESSYGLIIRVQGTSDRDGNNWNGGKYENATGFVVNVTVATTDRDVLSYASVRLRGEFEGSIVNVPYNCVKPVAPSEIGQRVIVVAGQRIGAKGTVREIEAEFNRCTAEIAEPEHYIDLFDFNLLTIYEEQAQS